MIISLMSVEKGFEAHRQTEHTHTYSIKVITTTNKSTYIHLSLVFRLVLRLSTPALILPPSFGLPHSYETPYQLHGPQNFFLMMYGFS